MEDRDRRTILRNRLGEVRGIEEVTSFMVGPNAYGKNEIFYRFQQNPAYGKNEQKYGNIPYTNTDFRNIATFSKKIVGNPIFVSKAVDPSYGTDYIKVLYEDGIYVAYKAEMEREILETKRAQDMYKESYNATDSKDKKSHGGKWFAGTIAAIAATAAATFFLTRGCSEAPAPEPTATYTPAKPTPTPSATATPTATQNIYSGTEEQIHYAKLGVKFLSDLQASKMYPYIGEFAKVEGIMLTVDQSLAIDVISRANGVYSKSMESMTPAEREQREYTIQKFKAAMEYADMNHLVADEDKIYLYSYIDSSPEFQTMLMNASSLAQNYINFMSKNSAYRDLHDIQNYDLSMESEREKLSGPYKNIEELLMGYQLETVFSSEFQAMTEEQKNSILGVFDRANADMPMDAEVTSKDGSIWMHTRWLNETIDSEWVTETLEDGTTMVERRHMSGGSYGEQKMSYRQMMAYMEDYNAKAARNEEGYVGIISLQGLQPFVSSLLQDSQANLATLAREGKLQIDGYKTK